MSQSSPPRSVCQNLEKNLPQLCCVHGEPLLTCTVGIAEQVAEKEAYLGTLKAMLVEQDEQVAQARAEEVDRLAHAIFWLLRAYDSGHRQGWEAGPSVKETMDGLFTWLCNEGFDPNEKLTPSFVPEIAAAIRARQ